MAGQPIPGAYNAPNVSSVRDLLMLWYENPIYSQPDESDYTIGTTALQLGATIGQRIQVVCSNTGSTNLAISWKSSITITTGFLLLPGGVFRLKWRDDGDLLMRPLFAISDGAGGTLHMLEQSVYSA